jgi:signal transduction histidine kinase
MNPAVCPQPPFDITLLLSISCLILLAGLSVALYLLIAKSEENKDLKAAYAKVMESFHELDEQAKLIVKTDLELNKTQEELDRRLMGLDTLQKLSRNIKMTLDEGDVFRRINQPLITEIGFSRAAIFTHNDESKFICRTNIGLDQGKIDKAIVQIEADASFFQSLKDGMTFSSMSSSQKIRASIVSLFDAEHFILTPMFVQGKMAGVLFVGNRYNAPSVTEGDKELILILAGLISQCIENAQLFEQVYRSSQMLEMKVNERTRELSHALKEVENVSKKKSEFISAVSHELRTPLTSIKGYASILMTGKVGEIPEAVKERLAKINSHSDNLVKLINDLLDIARIESGRVEMKTVLQPVKHMLDNIADLLTPQLNNKNLQLRLNIPADTPEIEFDATQVERVFINLVGNAIKFTPPGGNITINAITQWDRQRILFEVADTGIGIKKEDLNKLFSEFFRVDNEINMNVKGTGLGLALAKNIVEAHGGKMWVTSEPGVGTTFHFALPFKYLSRDSKKHAPTAGDET